MEATAEETPKENAANALPQNSVNVPEATPVAPPLDQLKKSRREERLKMDKTVEAFIKSLNTLPTLDERYSVLFKKFTQIADENRRLHFFIKQTDKKFAMMDKEKDQLQFDYNKVVLLKSKLENLCRELQKQNKAVKEESLLKMREEEERRKETQAKFQNTLTEITTLLQQNNEKNVKLRDDNISMTEKFKSVVQQYQLREQQVEKMAKQMSLESQLSDAKLQKAALEHQAEKERIMAEMEQLKVTLAQYRSKIVEMQSTETVLKGQLSVYTDKYDEFQNALVKSNQVFGGFKEQMDKMTKKIQKLEKESLSWKKRWETSQTALLDMCGEKQASEDRGAATGRQLQQMQSLCRTLQAERTLLLNTLKENNIERPPLPVLAPAPAPPVIQPSKPAPNPKVDAMAANCAKLKQSLKQIQTQLTTLSGNVPTKEEPVKAEKSKKSKSKKSKAEKHAQKQAAEKKANKEHEDENTKNVSEGNKIDPKAMESLFQAINNANMNLYELAVDNDTLCKETYGEDEDSNPLNDIIGSLIDTSNISEDAVVEEIVDDNDNESEVNEPAELADDDNNEFDVLESETASDEKVNETTAESSLIETPHINGNEVQIEEKEVLNENDDSIVEDIVEQAHTSSPDEEKTPKDAVVLEEKSKVDTQVIESLPVSIET